jgi:hypothetical protein
MAISAENFAFGDLGKDSIHRISPSRSIRDVESLLPADVVELQHNGVRLATRARMAKEMRGNRPMNCDYRIASILLGFIEILCSIGEIVTAPIRRLTLPTVVL